MKALEKSVKGGDPNNMKKLVPASGKQLVEQLTDDPEFEGSNLAIV